MSVPFFTQEFPSSLHAMAPVLNSALHALAARGWIPPDDTFHARLCLEEALVNAVKHGNRDNEVLTVRIAMTEEPDLCVIQVWDRGEGFRIADVPVPECEKQGGRGICLIRFFMDEVSYDATQNCLTMKMRRNALRKKE